MADFLRLSRKELLILQMLVNRGEMYGLEMVKASDGKLKRGTVYVTLGRMAEKGYVESRQEWEPGSAGMPKRLFQATSRGERMFQAWEMVHRHTAGDLA